MFESMQILSYLLLGAAVVAAWVPACRVGGRAVPVWAVVFVAAMAVGLRADTLAPAGVVTLLVLWALASAARHAPRARRAFATAAALLALALALHALPGFHPTLFQGDVRLTADATAFKFGASFDKGAAGLVLLAVLCRARPGTPPLDGRVVAWTLAITVATAAISIGLAMAVGYTRFEPKWPAIAVPFLAGNLLFTCVAEEAFFRGVIQDAVARLGRSHATGTVRMAFQVLAIAVSTALFGLAHLGGSPTFMAIATVAGLGYSLAYAKTGRIEAAILVHFAVNVTHFVGFTYPALAH